MPKIQTNNDHFKFIYRADCINCQKYVGEKRESKTEAEIDRQNHKSFPGNKDHEVKIEVTQSYHI